MTRLAGSSKLLRAMNESAALGHLLDPGMLTRADLRKLTALSTPTISEVLRRLTDAGLVRVVGHNSGRPGPNAEIYAAVPDAAYTVGVSIRDTGSSHTPSVTGALCDLTGVVRARVESNVDFLSTSPGEAILDVVLGLRASAGVEASLIRQVQIGVPGSYDPRTETIRHIDVPGFAEPGLIPRVTKALRQALATSADAFTGTHGNAAASGDAAVDGVHVGVDNDVNLAAVAERRRGAGRGTSGFALLWLGQDGLGLATDINGTLLRGARGGAGEIGYMPLFSPESADRKLDLQRLFGGGAILDLARLDLAPLDLPGLPEGVPSEIVRYAATNPGAGGRFLAVLAERIAIGLAAVIAVLDPGLVVLAGPVARAGGEPLLIAVANALRKAVPLESTLAITALDDDAVLLGALDSGLAAVRESLIAAIRTAY